MSETHEPCGNEECDKCHPYPRWKVHQHRVQHIVYERIIKAPTPEEALKIFNEGTSWPSSYDDNYGEVIQEDEVKVDRLSEEENRWRGEGQCYNDQLPQVFLGDEEDNNEE